MAALTVTNSSNRIRRRSKMFRLKIEISSVCSTFEFDGRISVDKDVTLLDRLQAEWRKYDGQAMRWSSLLRD